MNHLSNHPLPVRPAAVLRLGIARLLMAAAFSLPALSHAADITLDQALVSAERYSAELSANQHQVNALENMASSATQLPDPKLKFGIENLPVGGSNARRFTREGMTMQRIGIMQDYVSSDKRQRKADTLSAEARKTAAGNETIRTRLQKETAQAWLDLALTEQAASDAKVLVQESEKQIALQRAGVASGGALPSSVLDARLTLAAMQDRLTTAQRDVALAQTRLTQLTGIEVQHVDGPLPKFSRLPAAITVLRDSINQHPEILLASREAEVAKARSAQSAIAAIPDIGIEVYYAKRAEEYEDMAGVMVTVDLPLFRSQRQDKDYAADVSRTMEANDQLTLLTRNHRAQLDTLLAQYQATQQLWQRQINAVLPLQKQRVDLMMAQYQANKSDLSSVLEARRALLDSQLNTSNAARELARTWAAIRYLTPQESVR
ncbi:TolC family protein [Yersinia enterocolitica]|uniref:Outer membrane efflux protein n=1 Tax=Yersinia enterocolitica serotype O:8 / biotype 1B (strain NCTC 13174 / 8081) TaxID=393305 RepID=A1JQN4_YERE8|nr:TolC family protein [Yersinia enterocolitica]AJJ24320.1 outer membrane efflux family protein [Yersinia enterocolitica]CAL13656.1 outer membrane efflux protein [Yersinia enterocolitica subsp. enterocolitica 8081]CNJ74880.1 outer membrane efflux protein [Yersinia enterocolitica]CRY00301.1 outer membrane efflux protein [Yersinia enterocolitica]HDL7838016.1 TolC family protein [Yersinia enterocolitica]